MSEPNEEEEVFAFPASFAEQRLWFLDQVDPMTAVYNVVQGLRLEGPLDRARLEAALREVVTRHEALRTTFAAKDGTPLQIVSGEARLPFAVVDLQGRDDAEAEASRLARAEAETPFDLQKGPLVRALAIVLAPEQHVLVVNAHHIVCDGSSLAILFEEVSALYAGRELPEPKAQYADFTAWQSEWLLGAELERALAYWKPALAGELTVLELPGDRPRPQVFSFAGGSLRFRLPADLCAELGALARREGATPFMLFLAAFQLLLHRLSRQDEVLVGTPVVNRDRAEIERSIGFYTNTVVFRTALPDPDEPFTALLARVKRTAMEALAHQDVPFEKVVEAVHPARATSHNPIFQAMFGLQKAPESALALAGVCALPVDVHSGTSKFDLTLDMQELEDGMQGLLEYSSDLFDRTTAERFAATYETLLRGIAARPAAPVAELPLLREDEERALALRWNATDAPYPTACIHDLVAAQAKRTPTAIALEHEGEALTYAELDARASALAARLDVAGSIVGLFLERSIDMVVALLGVLKAGAAYLPLDPAYPADRIAYMLEDAKASLVVTQEDLAGELPEGVRTMLVSDGGGSFPAPPVSPEAPAYVIYTSGSTGKPKGVVVPHRAVVNFLTSMAREPGLGPDDRLVAVTTLSFDIAGLELLLPLTVGATVILASREAATDGAALAELLERATVLQATPATYRMLLESEWKGGPLKALCGGEALPPSLAEALLGRVRELWNMYGPTETTIWSTCARIEDPGAITIGKPIANTRVYVLDARMRPVPIGVTGDLYIAGDGVALGYHDRPELTEERFLADAFRPGARMYRTGDRARWSVDGDLHFLGRGDGQVKVRGFRIELGEIEAALATHEDLKQVVVTVRADETGDARIVAYVVHRGDAAPTSSELRKHLRTSLPEHMIPHFFVELAAIPLTQNGKVDRRALPDPFDAPREEASAPPSTETEVLVAEIWRDVLNVPAVGLRDNFFDLGGHSLLSMQVIHRLAARTGHRLNPRSMVYGNLQQVAAECERRT